MIRLWLLQNTGPDNRKTKEKLEENVGTSILKLLALENSTDNVT